MCMEEVQIRGPHFISTLPADIQPVDDNRSKIRRVLVVLGIVLLVGVPSVLSFYLPKHIIQASQEIIMAPFAVKSYNGEQFGNVSLSKNPTPTPATIQQQNQSTSSEQSGSEYTSQPASYYPATEVQQVIQPQGTQQTQNTQYMPFVEPAQQVPNTQNTNQIQDFFLYLFQQQEPNNQVPEPTSTPVPTRVLSPTLTKTPTPTRTPTPIKSPTPTLVPYQSTYYLAEDACQGRSYGDKCSYYDFSGKKINGYCVSDLKHTVCVEDNN